MDYKIHITFSDKGSGKGEVYIEADPPWPGPASGIAVEDMPPAQRMQLDWFQELTEMYSGLGED